MQHAIDRMRIVADAPHATRGEPHRMLGSSNAMARLRATIARVAPGDTTVLVIGESGSGKELVARGIHDASPRRRGPFIAVNCAAIPATLIEAELFGHERGSFTGAARMHAGVFERASGGTLFLDEVSEMPLELQTRLLRVLESRRFYRVGGSVELPTDVRIIAATNRNPAESMRDGRLREDLLYRLAVFPIVVPPLRSRGNDALEIAAELLDELNRAGRAQHALSDRSLEFLRGYRWPGNVRELRNAVERAWLLAEDGLLELKPTLDGLLSLDPVPDSTDQLSIRIGQTLEEVERTVIQATLSYHGGSKPKAAQALGCSLKTLYNKLNSYSQVATAAGI